jgi:hypothetical protein
MFDTYSVKKGISSLELSILRHFHDMKDRYGRELQLRPQNIGPKARDLIKKDVINRSVF